MSGLEAGRETARVGGQLRRAPAGARLVVRRLAFVLCALAPLSGAHADPVRYGPLPPQVQDLLARYRVPADALGVFVQEVRASEPLLAFNADAAFNPASAIKLLPTFVALDTLGPAYTWRTLAYADGPVRGERLYGNLFIKGYGDPFLVIENFWRFVRGIRAAGVKHISGDVVADRSYFEVERVNRSAFDGRPYRAYNAAPDALLLNYQAVRFAFVPDPASRKVRILPEPVPANLVIVNRLRLTDAPCTARNHRIRMQVADAENGGVVRFSGSYPAACGRHHLTRVIAPAAPFALGVFEALWREMGGTIDGELREGVLPQERTLLHSLRSRPLSDIIRGINKYSNNVMTRQLIYTLGAERFGPPGTRTKGIEAIEHWLRTHGLDFAELALDNGAGLSRATRISARSLGRLLLRAYAHPYMPEFVASLPIAGVDGTLRDRFLDDGLRGRVHLKTGRIDDVKAMAGYVAGPSGRTYVVVCLQNHPGIHRRRGDAVQDALLRWVYRR